MTIETRSLTAKEFLEKVAPNCQPITVESFESQLYDCLKTNEDFRIHYRDLTYIVFNGDIKAHFANRSAPVLSTGKALVAERLGEVLPESAFAADKESPATKRTTAKKPATKPEKTEKTEETVAKSL